jgi:hypothetical protein
MEQNQEIQERLNELGIVHIQADILHQLEELKEKMSGQQVKSPPYFSDINDRNGQRLATQLAETKLVFSHNAQFHL